jgi:ABC-type multidrug transport system fused ATPase/permease subunit
MRLRRIGELYVGRYRMQDHKSSDLCLVLALLCGAASGIAALLVGMLVCGIAPSRFAETFGLAYFLLLGAVVLSVVARLIAALFSSSIRTSIAAHQIGHAVWFGAAIGMVLLVLLLPRCARKGVASFRGPPNKDAR